MASTKATKRTIIKTDKSKPLMTGTQIILTLAPLDHAQQAKDPLPIVWVASGFQLNQLNTLEQTWEPNYAFSVMQSSTGNVVSPTTTIPIAVGQTANLSGAHDKGYVWSTPAPPDSDQTTMIATNDTETAQALTLGILSPDGTIRHIVKYPDVLPSNKLAARPVGSLFACYTESHQDGQVLDGRDLLGPNGVKLEDLGPTTTWLLYSNPETGEPSLEMLPPA